MSMEINVLLGMSKTKLVSYRAVSLINSLKWFDVYMIFSKKRFRLKSGNRIVVVETKRLFLRGIGSQMWT